MHLPHLITALRPRQWIKNLVCLAGLIFSGNLSSPPALAAALGAVGVFCLLSSSMYLINDVSDRRRDQQNPHKQGRPVASGQVPVTVAITLAAVLAVAGIVWSMSLNTTCLVIGIVYVAMNGAYSLGLKHAVIIDVMCIALGFVLRVLMGVYAVDVLPTPWIVLCMFFLALFLGFAKRRGELHTLTGDAGDHRPVLIKYSVPYLDMLMATTATMSIVCYSLYTVTGREDPSLLLTIPFVVYGIVRYQLLVMVRGGGHSPDEILTRDVMLLLAVAGWAAMAVAVLYFDFRPLTWLNVPA